MIVVAVIALIAAIAIPNLLRSRMASNETAAIAACRAYMAAQETYRRTDWNQDGVLEYARALSGANSLFETTAGAGDLALIEQGIAAAEGAPGTASPKDGYVFQVQTAEIANRSWLVKNYIINRHMMLGYGLSAVPASYDQTGRNKYQVNNVGVVYQYDGGNNTHMILFNVVATTQKWIAVE
jgi:type II secretory pathway pseudopilin PulG